MIESPECSICRKEYDDETHIPKILGCGHTFCRECLLYLIPQFGKCPLDKFKINVPSVELVPDNRLLIDMLEQPEAVIGIKRVEMMLEKKHMHIIKRIKGVTYDMNYEMTALKPDYVHRAFLVNNSFSLDQQPRLLGQCKLSDFRPLRHKTIYARPTGKSKGQTKNYDSRKRFEVLAKPKKSTAEQGSGIQLREWVPNYNVIRSFNPYAAQTKLCREPQPLDTFVITKITSALRKKRRYIFVQAPPNSDRVMLALTAVFGFNCAKKVQKQVILVRDFQHSIKNIDSFCHYDLPHEDLLPYSFTRGHFHYKPHYLFPDFFLDELIKNHQISKSNLEIVDKQNYLTNILLEDWFSIYHRTNCLAEDYNKNLIFDCSAEYLISNSLYKGDFVTADYINFLKFIEVPIGLHKKFVIIDCLGNFEQAMADYFNFGLMKGVLELLLIILNKEVYIQKALESEKVAINELKDDVKRLKELLENRDMPKKKSSCFVDLLGCVLTSFTKNIHRVTWLIKYVSWDQKLKFAKHDLEVVRCFENFILKISLGVGSNEKFSDHFDVVRTNKHNNSIFVKCKNPMLAFENLIYSTSAQIIFLCNSKSDLQKWSSKVDRKCTSRIIPPRELRPALQLIRPFCYAFIITHLHGISKTPIIFDSNQKNVEEQEKYDNTMKYIQDIVTQSFNTGGVVIFCASDLILKEMSSSALRAFRNSSIKFYSIKSSAKTRKATKRKERILRRYKKAAKEGLSLLFVPLTYRPESHSRLSRSQTKLIFVVGAPHEEDDEASDSEDLYESSLIRMPKFKAVSAADKVFHAVSSITDDNEQPMACILIDERYESYPVLQKHVMTHFSLQGSRNARQYAESVEWITCILKFQLNL